MKKNLIALTINCIIIACILCFNKPTESKAIETETKVTTETAEIKTTEPEFDPSYYPLLMQITEIDDGIITAIDTYGTSWSFTGTNAKVGDMYSCIMCDKGTEFVEDDTIVKMRKSNFKQSEYKTKGIVTPAETYYPLLMQATEIDAKTNMTTCKDRYGNSWKFVSEDSIVGDLYTCIMTDNGTPLDETDDEIFALRFSGVTSEYPAIEME